MALSLREENAKTLAALLGLDEVEASRILDVRVLVTYSQGCETSRKVADSVVALLSRTVTQVTTQSDGVFAAELVIGRAAARIADVPRVWLGADAEGAAISREPLPATRMGPLHPALALLTACYACALIMEVALKIPLPVAPAATIELDWQALFGSDLRFLDSSIVLGEMYLAGAGAVGNAFLYALQAFCVSGTLYICDPKDVMPGSFNRCLWFEDSDLYKPKALRLCERAQFAFPSLRLIPAVATLDQVMKIHVTSHSLERLIVGVDSRRARRSLQLSFPKEVFDASTTDVREIVVHFNRQPTTLACLSCIYPENDRELTHQQHVAEALGVEVAEVQQEFVTGAVAAKICKAYPDLTPQNLVGRAFDSLFKELCGQGALRNAEGRQVLAPFSFVSALAGSYLAIEVVRRCFFGSEADSFNYWRASPWHAPNLALRQQRGRLKNCEFCGNPTFKEVNLQIWEDSAVEA